MTDVSVGRLAMLYRGSQTLASTIALEAVLNGATDQ